MLLYGLDNLCLGSQACAFTSHIFSFSCSKIKSHKVLEEADVCAHHDADKDTHGSCALPASLPVSISSSAHAGRASTMLAPRLAWHLCPSGPRAPLGWSKKLQKGTQQR